MADLYITTRSGLAFDDSFTPPSDGDYGLTFSFDPSKGFSVSPILGSVLPAPPLGLAYAYSMLDPTSILFITLFDGNSYPILARVA